jgi:circadian clock protein KaiB
MDNSQPKTSNNHQSKIINLTAGVMKKIVLRLYVSGTTPRSVQAIANAKSACAGELKENIDIQVIDVLEHPELAEAEKIVATPTLTKNRPSPVRRIVGDLSDREKVLFALGLVHATESEER